jgi:hypothetical protein
MATLEEWRAMLYARRVKRVERKLWRSLALGRLTYGRLVRVAALLERARETRATETNTNTNT